MPESRKITIAGLDVTIDDKYSEGDTISTNEAAALNQTRAENVRNNTAAKVKEFNENPDESEFDSVEELIEYIINYADNYEFGARSGGRSTDPLASEMRDLAKKAIKSRILQAGGKISDFSGKELNAKVDEVLSNPDNFAKIKAKAEENLARIDEVSIEV